MSSLPWYHAGLRFQCTQCGDCCTGAPGYVWVNREEIATLAKALQLEVAEFEQRYVRRVGIRKSLIEFGNGDCVFFDTDRRVCQVYDARPRQCRTWPFWASNLGTPQVWEELAERCPGVNRGRVIALGKINACLGVVNV
jgi:uncharacterized protein